MEVPAITHRGFSILACLIDGRERTVQELRTLLHWRRTVQAFYAAYSQLQHDGLVRQTGVRCALPDGTHHGPVLVITDAGKGAWQECADFYVQMMQFKPPAARVPRACHLKSRRRYCRSANFRAPTLSEVDRLEQRARPEMRLLLHAMRVCRLSREALFDLKIGDVDFRDGTLRIRKSGRLALRTKIPVDLREVLVKAIGRRKSGRVFRHPRGGSWTDGRFDWDWLMLKRRAGVPVVVAPRGRPHSGGYRHHG